MCLWLKRLHTSCYKMQKCVNLAAGWMACRSSVISAFAYQQPIENGFACSGGEPAQKCGLCSLRLGLFGFFCFAEGQLEFRCPFPIFFWFAALDSHAVSSIMSTLAFPSLRGTFSVEGRGPQGPNPALAPLQEAADLQTPCD